MTKFKVVVIVIWIVYSLSAQGLHEFDNNIPPPPQLRRFAPYGPQEYLTLPRDAEPDPTLDNVSIYPELQTVTDTNFSPMPARIKDICSNNEIEPDDTVHCDSVYDGYLCWPPTRAGKTAKQHCPLIHLSDPTQMAYRVCDENAKWKSKGTYTEEAIYPHGYTNYTECFPSVVSPHYRYMFDLQQIGNDYYWIACFSRVVEVAGFSTSLPSLLMSVFIFFVFRMLDNDRVLIHKSLFLSMLMQVSIKLVLCIDQEIFHVIHQQNSTSFLCPLLYIISEYSVSASITWMLLEGAYMNSQVNGKVLRERYFNPGIILAAWVIPVFDLLLWAICTSKYYAREIYPTCWHGYHFSPYYWILQAPRLLGLGTTFGFFFNVMNIIRRTEDSEIVQVRKAINAGLILLLGLTHILYTIPPPMSNIYVYAIWTIGINFIRSFEGFFISLTYCFLNHDVQNIVRRYFIGMKARREARNRSRSPRVSFDVEEAFVSRPRTHSEDLELDGGVSEAAVQNKEPTLDMDTIHSDCQSCDSMVKDMIEAEIAEEAEVKIEEVDEVEEAEKADNIVALVETPKKKLERQLKDKRLVQEKRRVAHDLHWMEIERRNPFGHVLSRAARESHLNREEAGPSGISTSRPNIQEIEDDDDEYNDDVFYP